MIDPAIPEHLRELAERSTEDERWARIVGSAWHGEAYRAPTRAAAFAIALLFFGVLAATAAEHYSHAPRTEQAQ